MPTVKISSGNSKMGSIPSVSLPAGVTCRSCGCAKKCYAKKLERLRPNVANAYRHNLEVLLNDPDTYWREVEASIMMSRYFRFHVSGDIPSDLYFIKMIEVASRNPHCEILCFTKQFELVNEVVDNRYLCSDAGTTAGFWNFDRTKVDVDQVIPKNLHIVFSGWPGLKMDNPYNFPEAHVKFRDGTTTARSDAKKCSGNCTECAVTDDGCWVLKRGEQVVFDEH